MESMSGKSLAVMIANRFVRTYFYLMHSAQASQGNKMPLSTLSKS